MALIRCPECGKEITDIAKNCIHCGYPIKTAKKKLPLRKIGVATAITLFVVACILFVFFNNRLNDVEKANVEQTATAIANIGDVKINDDFKIIEAEKLYNALSKKCQRHVENRDKLLSARETYDNLKAEETIELINQIGTVTLSNQDIVDQAKKSYDALSDQQKTLVDNSESLLAAVKQLSNLKAEDVNNKISVIGTITLESKEKITEARKAYDALSDEEKTKVNSYDELVVAEESFEELAINNCIALINNIGKVTLNSKKKINNARKVYDLLSK